LQLYVPLNTTGVTHEATADFALAVGQVMERQLPGRVTTVMAKVERPGKVFVDWSQNAHHKTTIAPYSLRARHDPTVSTPVCVGRGRGVRVEWCRAPLRGGRCPGEGRRVRRPVRRRPDARTTPADGLLSTGSDAYWFPRPPSRR
jgi:hypothetical protein